jgi:hypothetical protein
MRCGAASSLDEGDEMATTVQDIIAGVEVLTTIPEWFGGGGGETKMTVRVGESGAMSNYERTRRRRLRHCVQGSAESRQ